MLEIEKVDLSNFLPVKLGHIREYKKGDFIYSPSISEGPRIFMVQKGTVFLETQIQVCLGKKARKVVFGVLGPEEVFGIEALCGQYVTSARCVEPTEVMYWETDVVRMLDAKPGFLEAMVCTAFGRVTSIQTQVERLHTMQSKERLKSFLVDMARKGSVNEQGMVRIPLLSHGDIADFIGTTREGVTHLMGQLLNDGFVSRGLRRGEVYVSIPTW